MKQIIASISLILFAFILQAQTAKTTWSDEIKLKKGSTDLSMAFADETGIYVQEGHMALNTYFVVGATVRSSATLIKFDKSFREEYRNDFNKELKGKEFEDFFFIGKKAWLMASDYNKKDKTIELFTAEIDKRNGTLKGDWKSLSTLQKDEKKDRLATKFAYNSDSSKMILVSTNWGKEKCSFDIDEFDADMKKVGKTTTITNTFEPKTFQLEDVIYTLNGNVVIVGRIYTFAEGKKKKSKLLEFQNYNIQLYNNTGKLIKEINTEVNGKWLVSSKVAQIPNKELVIAAFYSNQKKAKEINGMLVQRVDAATGDIISTSQKEISTAMINDLAEDEDETKQERKEREKLAKIRDEQEGFSKYLRFRNFVYTPDNGIVILAEKYRSYTHYSTSTTSGVGGRPGTSSTTVYQVYECGDMMMSKMDSKGEISWLQILPKDQQESIRTGSSSSSEGISFGLGSNFFGGYNWPFYAGLGSIVLPEKNMLAILFNDNPKNETLLRPGQKVYSVYNYGKSATMVVYLDVATGKYTRKALINNRDQPTSMPRLGVALANDFYIIGQDIKALGKSRIAVGKISFK